MRSDIVVVIPAYECAATLGTVVAGVRQYLERVIVVDDGSQDATAEVAAEAGAEVLRLEQNQGKGEALRRGIARALEASPRAVLLMDADGQHHPDDVPALIKGFEESAADLVIGSRLGDREPMPAYRYWTNAIGTWMLSGLTGMALEDSQSGYRLLAAPLLARLPLTSHGYAIESEMLLKAAHRGARIAHVPVRTIYDGNVSHYRPFRDTVRICCEALYYKVTDKLFGRRR